MKVKLAFHSNCVKFYNKINKTQQNFTWEKISNFTLNIVIILSTYKEY
jgi:hypothetical protein